MEPGNPSLRSPIGTAAPVAPPRRRRLAQLPALTAGQRREIAGLLPGLAVHTCVLLFVGCAPAHCDSLWLRAQLPLAVALLLLEVAALWAWPALSAPPLRTPRCVAGRLLFCSVPAFRRMGVGLARAVERPPLPGLLGAVADAIRILLGTGVSTVVAQGSFARFPPAGQLLLQLALLGLTWKPRAVCASPLLAAPLTRRRVAHAAAALEVVALPWLLQAHDKGALPSVALLAGRADTDRTCVAVVGYGTALVGLLPVILSAHYVRAGQQFGQPRRAVQWLALPWARANAALRWIHFTIGRACPSCPRGALAARDFQPGDVVASIPASCSIVLPKDASVAAAAADVLRRLHTDPAFNATFGPYLAALPQPGQLLAPELLGPAELAELQTPELERLIRAKQAALDAVYLREGAPLGLPKEALQYWAALVRTRNVRLLGQQRLVPAFDMFNHCEDPNMRYSDDGSGTVLLRATRAVAAGEELTGRYKTSTLHRPDAALFFYGYLPATEQGIPGQDLLLPAVDLPGYRAANPWAPTDATDGTYVPTAAGSWVSGYVLRKEHARLAARLAAMPTTEQQDEAQLDAGEPASWQGQLMVRFRLHRKRALRLALGRMQAAWAAAHGGDAAVQCAVQGGSRGQAGAAAGVAEACPLPAGGPISSSGLVGLLAQAAGEAVYAVRLRWRPLSLLRQPDVVMLLAFCAAFAFFMRRR